MTMQEIQKRLKEIKNIKDDNELAHVKEDALYIVVLEAIASGTCTNPEGCAELALKAREIKFTRWFA